MRRLGTDAGRTQSAKWRAERGMKLDHWRLRLRGEAAALECAGTSPTSPPTRRSAERLGDNRRVRRRLIAWQPSAVVSRTVPVTITHWPRRNLVQTWVPPRTIVLRANAAERGPAGWLVLMTAVLSTIQEEVPGSLTAARRNRRQLRPWHTTPMNVCLSGRAPLEHRCTANDWRRGPAGVHGAHFLPASPMFAL